MADVIVMPNQRAQTIYSRAKARSMARRQQNNQKYFVFGGLVLMLVGIGAAAVQAYNENWGDDRKRRDYTRSFR